MYKNEPPVNPVSRDASIERPRPGETKTRPEGFREEALLMGATGRLVMYFFKFMPLGAAGGFPYCTYYNYNFRSQEFLVWIEHTTMMTFLRSWYLMYAW